MPTVFTAAQLAASAAAGDPRKEEDFPDKKAYQTWQNGWFFTMTGETLEPVGDANRAKRWAATRRQRGKIEAQRARQQQQQAAPRAEPGRTAWRQAVDTERQRERRQSRKEEPHRRVDAQARVLRELLEGPVFFGATCNGATIENEVDHIVCMARRLNIISPNYETVNHFVDDLWTRADYYLEFLAGAERRLPRYDVPVEERMDGVPVQDSAAAELPGQIEYACATFARLSWPENLVKDLETGDYEALHISWAQRIHQAADQWLDANGWVHGKSAAATSEAMEL